MVIRHRQAFSCCRIFAGKGGLPVSEAVEAVFYRLLTRKPVSRSELAEAAGISRTYAVQLTDRLLASSVLTEVPAAGGEPGRPARLLAWHPDHQPAYLTGLVDNETVTLGWFRPGDGYLPDSECTYPHRGGATLTDALIGGIEEQRARQSFPLAGVGIAIPGMVDASRGLVVQALRLNLRNVLLRDSLEQHFRVPAVIERAPHAAALAESIVRGIRDLFYIDTGTGVGGGAVHHHRLLTGHHHAGGEVGHLVVDPGGPSCACGKRGCLEALISVPALRRRFSLPAGRDRETAQPGVREDVIHWLTVALTAVISLIDPATIVLGPRFLALEPELAARVEDSLSRFTLPEHRVTVLPARLSHPASEGVGMKMTLADLGDRTR